MMTFDTFCKQKEITGREKEFFYKFTESRISFYNEEILEEEWKEFTDERKFQNWQLGRDNSK